MTLIHFYLPIKRPDGTAATLLTRDLDTAVPDTTDGMHLWPETDDQHTQRQPIKSRAWEPDGSVTVTLASLVPDPTPDMRARMRSSTVFGWPIYNTPNLMQLLTDAGWREWTPTPAPQNTGPATVWTLLLTDRHTDPEVYVYTDLDTADRHVNELIDEYNQRYASSYAQHGLHCKRRIVEGYHAYVEVGPEGDSIAVKATTLRGAA